MLSFVRIKHLERILSGFLLLLLAGLFYLQILEGKLYRSQSRENIIRFVPIQAPRGDISDRNGVLLADHRLTFDVAIIPQETENLTRLLERLSGLVGVEREKLLRAYSKNFSTPFMPVKVIEDLDKEKAIILEERRDLPGMVVLITPRRHYAYGPETVHLLGVVGEISSDELDRLHPYGYRIKDLLGRGGIEESFDNYLRGGDGNIQLKVNNKGYKVATLGYRAAEKGKDLTLTIDIRLQDFIYSLFKDKRGVVCVMNPANGEILALVSSPSFDPNGDFSESFVEEGKPFLNRATQGLYPPGSTFKVAVGSMALEEKVIYGGTSFPCTGSLRLGKDTFKCWKEGGHGEQHVIEALRHSCNVFFYHVGLLSGADRIAEYARFFGFGEKSGIELPHEASGLVPTPLWKRLAKREGWYDGDTVNFAIGQGYFSVTPLQVLRMASVIATDGKLVAPHVIKQIGTVEVKSSVKRSLPLSEKTLSVVREGMIEVVNAPDGTGRYAGVPGLEIAGKTGTAQVPGKNSHAWFVGFSPIRNPHVSLVVLVEHGGMGGLAASQIASSVFEKMKELELL